MESLGIEGDGLKEIPHNSGVRIQTKGGIIAFVLTLLPFIDDYTTRS